MQLLGLAHRMSGEVLYATFFFPFSVGLGVYHLVIFKIEDLFGP